MSKKAIFIDGSNLFMMAKNLGIGRVNYRTLRSVLITEVGEVQDLFEKPIYVISRKVDDRIFKTLNSCGFNPVAAVSFGEEDDNLIKDLITKLPPEVSEIVLVSSDADFHDCLQVKVKAGVKVFVVGTLAKDQNNNNPMISEAMKSDFNFVELGDFKEKIMLKDWVEKISDGGSPDQKDNSSIKVEIFMRGNSSEIAKLLEYLSRTSANFPTAGIKIEINRGSA